MILLQNQTPSTWTLKTNCWNQPRHSHTRNLIEHELRMSEPHPPIWHRKRIKWRRRSKHWKQNWKICSGLFSKHHRNCGKHKPPTSFWNTSCNPTTFQFNQSGPINSKKSRDFDVCKSFRVKSFQTLFLIYPFQEKPHISRLIRVCPRVVSLWKVTDPVTINQRCEEWTVFCLFIVHEMFGTMLKRLSTNSALYCSPRTVGHEENIDLKSHARVPTPKRTLIRLSDHNER